MKIVLLLGLIALAAGLAWLASRPPMPKPYVDQYTAALFQYPGSEAAIDLGIERFRTAYADLADAAVGDRIRELYAETLYFHDTLKMIDQREALVAYMERMAHSIDSSRMTIDAVLRDRADVYLRWTMHFETHMLGRHVHSQTIGMTHLRFDEDGRAVLHQDFWDPASGLYRHVPVVGWVLDQIDQRMQSH